MEKEKKSRKIQSTKNIFTSILSQVVLSCISLYTARVIKFELGFEYIGLNGFIGNVVGLFSLAELGIGSAVTFALYKPLAEGDEKQVIAIMQFYRKAYQIIALVILGGGLILAPFIPMLAKSSLSNGYIYLVYALFICNTVFSYLLSYKFCILTADQKNYVITLVSLIFSILVRFLQLGAVAIFGSYIIYLCADIFCTLSLNLIISHKVNKMYPFIRTKQRIVLDKDTKLLLKSKIKALFMHSIGAKVVSSTDNILISGFFGLTNTGKFTSYNSIYNILNNLQSQLFCGLTASVGNYMVEKDKESVFKLYKKIKIVENLINVFVCACFFSLITPFVAWWLGNDALLPVSTCICITLNIFIQNSRRSIGVITGAAGLYEFNKYCPIIESILNLSVSFIFAKLIGLNGIILGTVISCFFVPFLYNPIYVFKNYFNKNFIIFFSDFLLTLIITIILCGGLFFIQSKLPFTYNTFDLLIRFMVSIFMSGLYVFLLYGYKIYKIFFLKKD